VVAPLSTRQPAWVTDPAKCWGRRKAKRAAEDGRRQCGNGPIAGSRHCRLHAGSGTARAHAQVRAEVARWTLGSTDVNPGDTLLQLISQSRARVEQYSAKLAEVVDDEYEGDLAAAMVGDSYVVSDDGHMQKVGEYIRGLAQLEANERDRCAKFCEMAIKANLETKRVELALEQGRVIAGFFRLVLTDPRLQLTLEQRQIIPMLMRDHLSPAALPAAG
jgi:hypothetical protein